MTDDSKLLELAATGAGFKWRWFGANFCTEDNPEFGTYKPWNPLTDDGDALRLAVKLGINISFGHFTGIADAQTPVDDRWFSECNEDRAVATRRAIVRAAASMGEQS